MSLGNDPEWNGLWPDWLDSGRLVEVELQDGSRLVGRLVIDEAIWDGEGDEFPVWGLQVDGGTRSFADAVRFRYLP